MSGEPPKNRLVWMLETLQGMKSSWDRVFLNRSLEGGFLGGDTAMAMGMLAGVLENVRNLLTRDLRDLVDTEQQRQESHYETLRGLKGNDRVCVSINLKSGATRVRIGTVDYVTPVILHLLDREGAGYLIPITAIANVLVEDSLS